MKLKVNARPYDFRKNIQLINAIYNNLATHF